MLFINQDLAAELLTVQSCIKIMEQVLSNLANGDTAQSLRSAVTVENGNLMGLMPGFLKNDKVVGAKIITVFPKNYQVGLPSHQGVVLVFDSETGQLNAIVDGSRITAVRTAAVSAVATTIFKPTFKGSEFDRVW